MVTIGTLPVAACSNEPPVRVAPNTTDGQVLARARARTAALLASAIAAGDRPGLDRVAADHRAHLVALGASGTPSASAAPGGQPAALMAAETGAAREAIADLVTVSAPVAVLLARIATSRAVHADLIAAAARLGRPGAVLAEPGVPSSGPSSTIEPLGPAARDALARLIAAEHAAVFAYGVITAWLPTGRRDEAGEVWASHRAARERYSQVLLAAGGRPPAARAAYQVGSVDDAVDAAALAVKVENGILLAALAALAQVNDGWRTGPALDAVRAGRQVLRWGGTLAALPGE
jgi:hypothetical protein